MCARNECDNARLRRLTTTRTFTCSPSVSPHSRVSCALLILVFTLSLVSDVSPFSRKVLRRQLHFTTHTQFQVQSSFLLDVVLRLCPVIVHSICIPNSCIFLIAKTGLLRCCLYSQGELCTKQEDCRDLEKDRRSQRPKVHGDHHHNMFESKNNQGGNKRHLPAAHNSLDGAK